MLLSCYDDLLSDATLQELQKGWEGYSEERFFLCYPVVLYFIEDVPDESEIPVYISLVNSEIFS